MYLRAALLLVVRSAATGTVSSCRLSGEAARARDPFRREYSDQEWLAMVMQCEHQPRILWKGTSIESFNGSGWTVGLDGLLFYDTPARVLDHQLSEGLLSRKPRLFLPLFDAEDATVVLTGIYAYGRAGHFDGEDAASVKAALRQTLGHIDTRVRCSAIETLARKGWLGVDDVRRGLMDDALIVRNITASYLGSVVRNELADTSPLPMTQERARAIQQRLAPVLLDHLNDTYFFVRFKCATTFLDLFPRSNRPAWFPWDKADWHRRVRMQQEWKAWWAQQGKRVLHGKGNGDSRYSATPSA